MGVLVVHTTTHINESQLAYMLMHAITARESSSVVSGVVQVPSLRVSTHSPWLVGKTLYLFASICHHRCEAVLSIGHCCEKRILSIVNHIYSDQTIIPTKIMNFVRLAIFGYNFLWLVICAVTSPLYQYISWRKDRMGNEIFVILSK